MACADVIASWENSLEKVLEVLHIRILIVDERRVSPIADIPRMGRAIVDRSS
jgi:hypothetical protein